MFTPGQKLILLDAYLSDEAVPAAAEFLQYEKDGMARVLVDEVILKVDTNRLKDWGEYTEEQNKLNPKIGLIGIRRGS